MGNLSVCQPLLNNIPTLEVISNSKKNYYIVKDML
jgi:hypothetical protein